MMANGNGIVPVSASSKIRVNWMDEETEKLLELWAADEIQCQLDGTSKDAVVYEQLSAAMHVHGYTRTPVQIRCRINNLKQNYRHLHERISQNGVGSSSSGKQGRLKDRELYVFSIMERVMAKNSHNGGFNFNGSSMKSMACLDEDLDNTDLDHSPMTIPASMNVPASNGSRSRFHYDRDTLSPQIVKVEVDSEPSFNSGKEEAPFNSEPTSPFVGSLDATTFDGQAVSPTSYSNGHDNNDDDDTTRLATTRPSTNRHNVLKASRKVNHIISHLHRRQVQQRSSTSMYRNTAFSNTNGGIQSLKRKFSSISAGAPSPTAPVSVRSSSSPIGSNHNGGDGSNTAGSSKAAMASFSSSGSILCADFADKFTLAYQQIEKARMRHEAEMDERRMKFMTELEEKRMKHQMELFSLFEDKRTQYQRETFQMLLSIFRLSTAIGEGANSASTGSQRPSGSSPHSTMTDNATGTKFMDVLNASNNNWS